MQLQTSTWLEVETYLASSTGFLIPIGATEQHGPNGLIGTDAICPETVARRVGDSLGALVGPTLNVGMSQHHMAFAGSMTLRPSTLISVVRDVVESVARHGFDSVYFLNGHGGNIATVNTAFGEIYGSGLRTGSGAPVRLRLRNWWSGKRVNKLGPELFANSDGAHATASEVSLSWYAHPDAVKRVEMSPKVAPYGPIRDAEDYRKRFPDGRIGSDPSLATVEAGEKLCAAAVADVEDDYRQFLQGG